MATSWPMLLFNDPFLSDMERAMLERNFRIQPNATVAVSPPGSLFPVDIVEEEKCFTIVADAPGYSPDELKVEVAEGNLTVSAERKILDNIEESPKLIRGERHPLYRFSRTFALPESVQPNNIMAKLDKGILHVMIPKVDADRKPAPRRIHVLQSAAWEV